MKPCNAVDRKACHNCHIGHAHLSVIDNGHLADLLLISRIAGLDLIYKAAVDLLHDLIDTGEQLENRSMGHFSRASDIMV